MNLKTLKYTYGQLLYTLLITLSIWLAGVTGLSGFANGMFYDLLTTLAPADNANEVETLLIEGQPQFTNPDDTFWLQLLDELGQLKARIVVFGFLPTAPRSFYERAVEMGNVIFGRRLVINSQSTDELMLEPLPDVAQGIPLHFGIIRTPAGENGIHRHQLYGFDVRGTWYPTVESVAASLWHGVDIGLRPTSPYLINYLGRRAGLPKVALEQALAGALIPEIVAGKSVFIGLGDQEGDLLYTPISRLSPLQIHGQALETLLEKRVIKEVHPALILFLLLATTVVTCALLQLITIRFVVAYILIQLVVGGLFAWLALTQLHFWLPLFDFWLLQIALLSLHARTRSIRDERRVHGLLFETSAHIRDRLFPVSFYSSQEHWTQVVTMVNQTLNLQRLIFLERVQDNHRVREVKALNCTINDIKDKRRDYERTPYSTAIAENRAIVVKDYLQRGETDEVQFLVPLVVGGNVFGFWAFGILPQYIAALPNFDAVIDSFADQIAELLFKRDILRAANAQKNKKLWQYLRLEMGQQNLAELGETFALMVRRLNVLEDHLNELTIATILYDLFGRVLNVNRTMADLLRGAQLSLYDMTALDFLCAVTSLDQEQARRMLQTMVFDRCSLMVSARVPGRDNQVFSLRLSPVLPQEGKMEDEADARPFRLEGILCELLDITEAVRPSADNYNMLKRVHFQVRNDLESLLTAVSLLMTAQTADEKARVFEIFRAKIDGLVHVLAEVETYQRLAGRPHAVEYYPIDALRPITEAVENIRDKAAQKILELDVELPDLANLVLASPDALQQLFAAILLWLIEDSIEMGKIVVRLENRSGRLIYDFANVGFGMDNSRLQSILSGSVQQDSIVLRQLCETGKLVSEWGGILEAYSELGVGTRFCVNLKGFII